MNLMDVFIIVSCTIFSGIVTLFFSMHKAVEIAQNSLRDENSIFYRIFISYLKHKRNKLTNRPLHSEGQDRSYGTMSNNHQNLGNDSIIRLINNE